MRRTGSGASAAYGTKLIKAAISGINRIDVMPDAKPEVILTRSLTLAIAGGCAAWLGNRVSRRSARPASTWAGAGLGLLAALVWSSRGTAWNVASSVGKEVERVRAEHWLELNPIDYA